MCIILGLSTFFYLDFHHHVLLLYHTVMSRTILPSRSRVHHHLCFSRPSFFFLYENTRWCITLFARLYVCLFLPTTFIPHILFLLPFSFFSFLFFPFSLKSGNRADKWAGERGFSVYDWRGKDCLGQFPLPQTHLSFGFSIFSEREREKIGWGRRERMLSRRRPGVWRFIPPCCFLTVCSNLGLEGLFWWNSGFK